LAIDIDYFNEVIQFTMSEAYNFCCDIKDNVGCNHNWKIWIHRKL